jgi:hemoglobin
MRKNVRIALLSLFAAVALAACGGKAKTAEAPAPDTRSLYERLGGKDAITAVVKDFVEVRVAKDNRINAQFANADIPKLEAHLVDQVCQATGGPCEYKGKDMKAAHVGMKITEADFDATVEDLKASLDHFKVPEREQKELLGALAAMRGDIVTVK